MAAQPGKVDKSRNQDDPAHAGTPDKKPDDEANDDHHSHQHERAPSFTGKRFPLSMTKPHRPLAIRHPFRNRRCLFLFRRTLRPRQQKRRFLGTGALLHLPLQTARGRGIRLRHAAHQLNGTARPRILRATASRVVLPQPPLHVRRHPAIQRGIGASEQVDIPHGFPSCEAPCNGLIPLKNMVLSGCSEPAPPGCPKRGAFRTPPQKRGSGHAFFRILSVLGEGTHRTDSRNAEQDSEHGGHREQHAIPVVPCNGQRRKLRNGTGQQQLRPIGDEPLHDA